MSKAHGYHRFSDLVFVPMAECGEDCEIHQYERDDAAREVYRTKSGKVITDEMIEQWAAEAERGYDLPAETGKPEKVCIGCEAPKGDPHKTWCPVMTGTLRTLPGRGQPEQDDEDFPIVCGNGCPEGYLGRHKFSCSQTRSLR